MKIGLRILLSYLFIVLISGWMVITVVFKELQPGVRATLEDNLKQQAQMLALLLQQRADRGELNAQQVAQQLKPILPSAFTQTGADSLFRSRVYVTNQQGTVIFDSSAEAIGADYSSWNDVYRTLRGEYGARSSRRDPDNPASSVMHVAAAIYQDKQIVGVVTVARPLAAILPFISRSQEKVIKYGAIIISLVLLIGLGFSYWLNRSFTRLIVYAGKVERGEKAVLPAAGKHELGQLGRALESMRLQLDGRAYVEELSHTIAHELKSPIAAIQASAELLKEDLSEAERQQFLTNILEQNQRQQDFITRLLELVKLEKQQQPDHAVSFELAPFLQQIHNDCCSNLQRRRLQLVWQLQAPPNQQGFADLLLLRHALANLIDNAADFSPPDSTITLTVYQDRYHQLVFEVQDQGSGIPDYALDKVTQRFYSLPRPNGQRSSGLGLSFVAEVAKLHKGQFSIGNRAGGGCCARLILPALV